ncbi:hypothetical protein PAMA_013760 [Pampus argenteus]
MDRRLQILLVLFFKEVACLEVSGYLGKSVTLPSGGNSSWNPTTIKWSIFTNNTWIGTYIGGKTVTNRLDEYTGRLSLNISSGDLTIHNLKSSDAMEYTVDIKTSEKDPIVNKIKLTVKQHLQEPTVKKLYHAHVEGGCWMAFNCTSADQHVTLTWRYNKSLNPSHMYPNDRIMLLFLNQEQTDAKFTCVSNENKESVSSQLTRIHLGGCGSEVWSSAPRTLGQTGTDFGPRSRQGLLPEVP